MSKLVLKSAALAQTVKADTAASYDSTGQVTFTPNTDVTGPVDPSDPTLPYQPTDPNSPDGKPQPGTAGPTLY
ncbi:WxL domain-containing protein [Lactococcus lactis]